MQITDKTTKAELVKLAQDWKCDAIAEHAYAKRLEDKLASQTCLAWWQIAAIVALPFAAGLIVGAM